mmetsp:Transcript_91318/g.284574  ORF Transcript_91318/g.284574 Transcript_91318/m.284574 type:complete len:84 (-) Transcript_91318:7-258(-)
MAARNLSGSLLNPVVVLAFSELEAIYHHRERCLLYIIWELVGAIVATLLFMLTHAHLYREGARLPNVGGPMLGGFEPQVIVEA